MIGLTDADGDFLNYTVDVVSLTLERSNGTIVETLPVRQRVDFAELVDVTELVTSATIPNGNYVAATLRLDYVDAEVSVEIAGAPAQAVVVDEDGDALGVVDLELELDNANHVVVAPGTPALLQIDFDLAASHAVNISTTPAVAVAAPFLVASIEPVDVKDFRVRGPLVSVDETASNYVIDIRPFNHPTAEHGEFTIETTADTAFEIDGDESTGVAGLALLADKPANTPTVAQGVYNTTTREFIADRVLAGTSVPGAAFDAVIGNVLARNGNELTVRGGTVVLEDDRVVFVRPDITVLIGPDTAVTQFGGGGGALDIDDISVGQRIHAFGEASGTVSASVPNLELDATAGRVRLHVTQVLGTVVDAVPGQITLDLFSIDGRSAEFFDFTGTGGSILTDADPENYEIDTDVLDVSDFEAGRPRPRVRLRDALRCRAAGLQRPDAGELRRDPRVARHRLGIQRHGRALHVDGRERFRDRRDQPGSRRSALHQDRATDLRHHDAQLADDDRAGHGRPDGVRDQPRPACRDVPGFRAFRRARERAARRRLEHAGAHGAGLVRRPEHDADRQLRRDRVQGAVRAQRPRQDGTVPFVRAQRGQSLG